MTQALRPSPALLNRARGALLGLAVGDALGTTLEFSRRDTLPHHTEMTGGGPFNLQPADSDGSRPPIPTRSRPAFRFDVGHHSEMKPATR